MSQDHDTPLTASGQGGGESVLDSEEPQGERGAPGSRDEGFPPGEGPANRPVGTSDAGDSTKVDPQDPQAGPTMPAGDQGG
jgi:hypothetical protein